MRFAAFGVCWLQQQAVLAAAGWLALVSAFAPIAGVGFYRRASPVIGAGAMFIGFAALGFAWAAALAHLRLRIPRSARGSPRGPSRAGEQTRAAY
jgi:hypothetical protein